MNLCDCIEWAGIKLERGKPEDALELIFQEIRRRTWTMTTRVNNALVCPNDDVIYTGSECPVCMSRLGHPLRTWICPMNPVVGGKHEPSVYPSVQKEQPQSTDCPWDSDNPFEPPANPGRPKLHLFKQAHVEGTGDGDCT